MGGSYLLSSPEKGLGGLIKGGGSFERGVGLIGDLR